MAEVSMQDPIVKRIIKARVQMLMNQNMAFFGTLAIRLQLREIQPEHCPTMGTDGKYLYFNRAFVDSLDNDELKYMLAHSVLHCCYDHMNRRGRRDPEIYSEATDHIVNIELNDMKMGKMPSRPNAKPPLIPAYDPKYKGMTSDQLYEKLLDEKQKNGNQNGKQQGGQGGQSQSGGGQGQDQGQGGGGHSFDTHFDPDKQYDEDSGIANLTPEERAILSDEIKQATMQAAKAAGAGRVPLGIQRMLDDLLEPQMDWREYLNMTTQSLLQSDYTYVRPNRRNSSLGGIILPGHDNDVKVSVCCAIDTSGSISDVMIKEFISEVKGIMEQFKEFELIMWCFDTETYTIWKYTHDNIDDIYDFYPEGGGGTDFMANWKMMRREEIEPDQLIVFTDGYPCGEWGEEDYQENLIFLISGSKEIVAPIGQTLYYDSAEGDY